MIVCPAARMSPTSRYTSTIQPKACGGGLMLSSEEANATMGELILRTSNVDPSLACRALRASWSPMNSLSTRNCSSSPFS